MYSKIVLYFRTNTTSRKSPTTKGGMMISTPGCFRCASSDCDAEGDVRIGLDDLGNRAVGLVAQELDMFGMLARVGHPDAALLHPVLIGLRHRRGDADVIEDEHGCLRLCKEMAAAPQAPPPALRQMRLAISSTFDRLIGVRQLEAVGIGLDLGRVEAVGGVDVVVLHHVLELEVAV